MGKLHRRRPGAKPFYLSIDKVIYLEVNDFIYALGRTLQGPTHGPPHEPFYLDKLALGTLMQTMCLQLSAAAYNGKLDGHKCVVWRRRLLPFQTMRRESQCLLTRLYSEHFAAAVLHILLSRHQPGGSCCASCSCG